MRGLIEKDLRLTLQRKQTIVVFVVMALFLAISGSGTFAVTYFTMLAGIVAIGTLSYDEFDNGLEFLMTLPIDRKTYIREKYIFALSASTVAWCISIIIYYVCELTRGSAAIVTEEFPFLFVILPSMASFATIIIPLQLKFGAEKGRVALFVIFGCIAVLIIAVKKLFITSEADTVSLINGLQGIPMGTVICVILALCVLVGFISYFCSIRIMEKKEL